MTARNSRSPTRKPSPEVKVDDVCFPNIHYSHLLHTPIFISSWLILLPFNDALSRCYLAAEPSGSTPLVPKPTTTHDLPQGPYQRPDHGAVRRSRMSWREGSAKRQQLNEGITLAPTVRGTTVHRSTLCNVPEDLNLHQHGCESLKPSSAGTGAFTQG